MTPVVAFEPGGSYIIMLSGVLKIPGIVVQDLWSLPMRGRLGFE